MRDSTGSPSRQEVRVSAIIAAAGSGTRLGLAQPKAFVSVGAHPLLYYSLRTIRELPQIVEAIITIPPGADESARAQVSQAGLRIPVKLIQGGAERQDSVRIALSITSAESELVIVHDAARPFVSVAIFQACIDAAARSSGAIAAVPVSDTLKQARDGVVLSTSPREGLFQAQTPQAFRRDLLITGHAQSGKEAITATDDAYLVEQLGVGIEIVAGSALSFKITTPEDLRMARALIASDAALARQFD